MARIRDSNGQSGGVGFVFRYDEKNHVAYLLTDEHVVKSADSVSVQFFAPLSGVDGKCTTCSHRSVEGTVFRRDKGKDLAVVKVSGEANIPHDVMILQLGHASALMAGDNIEILTYSLQDGEWSVLKAMVEALRPEKEGAESIQAIRFTALIREGDSGAPLIMEDQVYGVVESAPVLSNDRESPRAVQIATIEEFLRDLLPEQDPDPMARRFRWHPAKPNAPVDREAKTCATAFLDLLIDGRVKQAYQLVADARKSSVSEALFIGKYQSFTWHAKGGLIDRKLGDWQSFSYPPDTPQLVAPTYIITFESTYQPLGAIPTYETVTIVKENRNWRVMEFTWNSQTSDTSAR
jgi:S1-C subfamily serine protease